LAEEEGKGLQDGEDLGKGKGYTTPDYQLKGDYWSMARRKRRNTD